MPISPRDLPIHVSRLTRGSTLSYSALPYVAGFGLGLVLVLLAGAGYSPINDIDGYIEGADGWLAHMPFVGTTHWHLRHPFVLAIAASFAALARGEFALMLPTLLAYAGIVMLTIQMVRSLADDAAAALAAVLVASVPLLVLYARIPLPDEFEVALVLLSLFLFLRGIERQRLILFLLSGSVVGIAWLVRESCLPLIVVYGTLFLIGWRAPRALYLWLIVGFAPLVFAELAFFWITTGDPMYRFGIDAHSLEIPTPHMYGKVAGGLRPPFNLALMAKWVPNSIHVHWLVDPYLDLLVNASYGPIFWTGIPAAIVMCGHRLQSPIRDFSRVVCAIAASWIIIEIWVLNVRPQPRYFGPVTWAAAVMTALWLRETFAARRGLVLALVSAILAINLLASSMRPDPARPYRVLAAYAASSPEPVWTNLSGGIFLQDELGVADRVHVAPPENVPIGRPYVVTKPEAISLGIAEWPEIFRYRAVPPLLLRPLALLDDVSPTLAALIRHGSTDVLVLRAPAGQEPASGG